MEQSREESQLVVVCDDVMWAHTMPHTILVSPEGDMVSEFRSGVLLLLLEA